MSKIPIPWFWWKKRRCVLNLLKHAIARFICLWLDHTKQCSEATHGSVTEIFSNQCPVDHAIPRLKSRSSTMHSQSIKLSLSILINWLETVLQWWYCIMMMVLQFVLNHIPVLLWWHLPASPFQICSTHQIFWNLENLIFV